VWRPSSAPGSYSCGFGTIDQGELALRIARVRDQAGSTWLARVEDDKVVPVLPAEERFGADALRDALGDALDLRAQVACAAPSPPYSLISPLSAPQKIMAIGLNYVDHAREAGLPLPDVPVMFMKAGSALIGPGEAICYRSRDTSEVDYEGELAVVVGRRARDVSVNEALGCVFGYTVCNDVSARDAQFGDGQFTRGKSFDTFCPVGPWVTTRDEIPDIQALPLRTRVNGVLVQDGSTADMVFSVAEIVSYLSRFITLMPGDLISTGTPAGVGFVRQPPLFLTDGDVVEIEIGPLGRLTNPVKQVD
jgi:2-keto-4-pentenoate hydratase/2-oxohepta-3-ene-1,7-dioic acid hydratase in catechol pathway